MWKKQILSLEGRMTDEEKIEVDEERYKAYYAKTGWCG
jgi:hypothetical protein